MKREVLDKTWFDYAIDRRTPPVWRADNRNDYRLLGQTNEGVLYEVWANLTKYALPLPLDEVWSGATGATEITSQVQRLRATFHSSEYVGRLSVDRQARIPEHAIAKQLFGGLVSPVYGAFCDALDEARRQARGTSWDQWQAQHGKTLAMRESDHWFKLFAPRHARPVIRMTHEGMVSTYSMRLEWATLERH